MLTREFQMTAFEFTTVLHFGKVVSIHYGALLSLPFKTIKTLWQRDKMTF